MILLRIFLISLLTIALPAQANELASQTATISGELSYPGDYLPPLIVCAEAVNSKKIHCTGKRVPNRKNGKSIYNLKVPAGSYYVFATVANGEEPAEDVIGYKAYYSEYVKCGLKVDCPSHNPVKVTVRANQVLKGINPEDWYAD